MVTEDPGAQYEPRTVGADVLYQTIEEHFQAFLDHWESRDKRLPRHVQRPFWHYLACGDPREGFALLRCENPECDSCFVVPFSCKCPGFCPSCLGCRMSQTAAALVDGVIPRVPVRQWVLTLPLPLRLHAAWDPELRKAVLRVFLGVVERWVQRRAASEGHGKGQTGSVTVTQAFGSTLKLNLHS
jgi:hypothetical protein